MSSVVYHRICHLLRDEDATPIVCRACGYDEVEPDDSSTTDGPGRYTCPCSFCGGTKRMKPSQLRRWNSRPRAESLPVQADDQPSTGVRKKTPS